MPRDSGLHIIRVFEYDPERAADALTWLLEQHSSKDATTIPTACTTPAVDPQEVAPCEDHGARRPTISA
jgi:hypothetical protein